MGLSPPPVDKAARPPKLETRFGLEGLPLSALAAQLNIAIRPMEGTMSTTASSGKLVRPEAELEAEENNITRIAWSGGIAVTVVTAVVLGVAVATAGGGLGWHVALYAALAGVPFSYAIFSNVIMRRMEVAVFARYRNQLLSQIEDLSEMVYRDELTGLYNRRHFYEVARVEIEKSKISKRPLAIVLMDLDGLKRINDEHGHNVGDVVIANLGRVIAAHTRLDDVPARLGGDEFGIVMPGTDKRGAFSLARRLWMDLEQIPMYESNGMALTVTVSIGLAGYPWGGETVEEMIQWADADMYANKVSRNVSSAVPIEEKPTDLDSVTDDILGGV
jgi:diguanylate cyclase (GGDEF)-like protein